MGFIRDRQSRLFVCVAAALCIGLAAAAAGFCFWLGGQARDLTLARDRAAAASLLEQGVSPQIVAAALGSAGTTPEGDALVRSIGMTEGTALRFLPQIYRLYRRCLTLSLLCAAIFILLFLGNIFWFLSRRERLYADAIGTVTRFAEGDFTRRLPRSQSGALYQLFSAVNELSTALQAKGDRERAARDFLKDTISDISHQLKTPLAALNMYQEIISQEPDRPETVLRFSVKMEQALTRISQLIQALLKITRLDAGSITFDRQELPMAELAARSTQELAERARAEGKALTVTGDPGDMLCCDLQWTGEAISNLIKNALDHTRPGGGVHLSWERTPAMLRISVQDDGEGIAPDDLPHIFKRFYRSRHSQDTEGIGLGLPLAKSIIEGQGGVLSVQSRPGEGAVFTASFLTKP